MVQLMGSITVLALSSLLVKNNRKLRQAGESLTQKNIQINHQKQHLLAEVHHRVKNNLAIMSALMELENMMIEDPKTNLVLDLIQSRILSMSAVHEVLYKTDKFNQIQVQEILPGITNYFKNSNPEIIVESSIQDEPVQINVNQALTYALLINEFMNYIKKSNIDLTNEFKIKINVKYESDYIVTEISTNKIIDLIQDQNDIGFELIHVLIEQLDAYLTKVDLPDGIAWKVGFKLDDKKGITSDNNFRVE
jgi:two-component sensor histidine kinase